MTDMPFWIAGGSKRFRSGEFKLSGRSDVELYTTILRGLGINAAFGDQAHYSQLLPLMA